MRRMVFIVDIEDVYHFKKDLFDYINHKLKKIKCHVVFSGDLIDDNMPIIHHAINNFKEGWKR